MIFSQGVAQAGSFANNMFTSCIVWFDYLRDHLVLRNSFIVGLST